jgi:pyruvate/oxaloacetate carboxyltransferase
MAGLLKPYVAFDLVTRLKKELDIPVHMQCHATTGLSTATALKAVHVNTAFRILSRKLRCLLTSGASISRI